MTKDEKTRTVRAEIRIDAPPERVWKALTDPGELVNWFPLEARVTPEVDGSIFIAWGDDFRGDCRIRTWEPGRRLTTTWYEEADRPREHELVVDYRLEGDGGSTVLRLVHSGFGEGSEWDEEYDGVRRGWRFELRSLRHYLERKSGKTRHVAWARVPVDLPVQAGWERLWGPGGVLTVGASPIGDEGERYSLTVGGADRLEGEVLVHRPPTDFAGTVENLEGSLFRTGIEVCNGRREAWLWLSSWDLAVADVAAVQERWTAALKGAF